MTKPQTTEVLERATSLEKIAFSLEKIAFSLEKIAFQLELRGPSIGQIVRTAPWQAGECLMCGGVHGGLPCPLQKPMSAFG